MSAFDRSLASLKAMESKEVTGLPKATSLCLLGVAAMLPMGVSDNTTLVVYKLQITSGACSQVSEIRAPTTRQKYVPKTPLGERLLVLREQAIARGIPLLTEVQILEEVMRRRGELPGAEA